MKKPLSLAVGLLLLAPSTRAVASCRYGFEVVTPSGNARPAKRAAKMAQGGTCEFEVRLRTSAPEDDGCAVTRVAVRGLPRRGGVSGDGWTDGWQRVVLEPRRRKAARHVLRARMRMASGARARAHLALTCEPAPVLQGCGDVLTESTYCYIGGGDVVRVAGLDTGTVCRPEPQGEPVFSEGLFTTSLAVWHGEAYTCSSVTGAFVATPLDGSRPRVLAGGCTATATDGEELLVLAAPDFPTAPPPGPRPVEPPHGRPIPVNARLLTPEGGGLAPAGAIDPGGGPLLPPRMTPPSHIRAYAAPQAVPDGASRTVFDLSTIPAESPCAGLWLKAMTAHDGFVFAAGCRPGDDGCTPAEELCVFDTRSGVVLPLVLEDFSGPILGMSAIGDGRLLVLTRSDGTALPPIGYGSDEPPPGGGDLIHVFDTSTGARLDTRTIGSFFTTGLACVAPPR